MLAAAAALVPLRCGCHISHGATAALAGAAQWNNSSESMDLDHHSGWMYPSSAASHRRDASSHSGWMYPSNAPGCVGRGTPWSCFTACRA